MSFGVIVFKCLQVLWRFQPKQEHPNIPVALFCATTYRRLEVSDFTSSRFVHWALSGSMSIFALAANRTTAFRSIIAGIGRVLEWMPDKPVISIAYSYARDWLLVNDNEHWKRATNGFVMLAIWGEAAPP